jgi:hypothetical protein
MNSGIYGKYNQLWSHCIQVGLTVVLYKLTQTVDYQGCQPLNEKLQDQPNKRIIFYSKLQFGWGYFLTLNNS